jgi:hypothetical protein
MSLSIVLAFSLPPYSVTYSFNWILNMSFDFAKGQTENINNNFFGGGGGVGENLPFLNFQVYVSPVLKISTSPCPA